MTKSYTTTLGLLASVLVAPALSAQYKPSEHQYRVVQEVQAKQTMQGQTQETNASTLQLLSVKLTPAGQGLGFTLTVDSAATEATGAAAAQQAAANAELQKMKGASVTGTASPLGEMTGLAASDTSSSAAQQLVMGAKGFLPRLPAGGLKAGATWNDSVTNSFNNQGIDGKTTVISKHTVAGDTTIAGRPAWKLVQTGDVKMSGGGMTQGTEVSLTGTGKLSGTAYVSKDGTYLGGEQLLTQDMTIDVPAAGMSIPMQQRITTKVTLNGGK